MSINGAPPPRGEDRGALQEPLLSSSFGSKASFEDDADGALVELSSSPGAIGSSVSRDTLSELPVPGDGVSKQRSFGDGTAGARAALRRAARKAVLATAITRPVSSKGVPLLRARFVTNAVGNIVKDEVGQHGGDGAGGDGATRAMPSDGKFEVAARFVRDALAGRSPNTRLAAAVGLGGGSGAGADGGLERLRARHRRCRLEDFVFSRWNKWLLQLLIIFHCVLSAFEHIPPSTNPSMPPFQWWVGAVEVVLLCVYTLDQLLIFREFGLRYFRDKKWEAVFAITTICLWADWALYYPIGLRYMFRFARPFRPLLGIAKRKSLRRLLASILLTIPHVLDVSLLLFLLFAFFGSAGSQLFNDEQVPGYSQGDDNFNSWASAALAMFELQTTENYPNVASLSYLKRPAAAGVFFVIALFVMLWVITPLILAKVYNHYIDVHKALVKKKRVKQYASLVFAYQVLQPGGDGDGELHRDAFIHLVRKVRPLSIAEAEVMFDTLDVDGSGAITIAEFLRLPVILRLEVGSFAADATVGLDGAAQRSGWPRLRRALTALVRSRWFFIAVLLILLGTCALASTWTMSGQRSYDACMCYTVPPAPTSDSAAKSSAVAAVAADLRSYWSWATGAVASGSSSSNGSSSSSSGADVGACIPGTDCGLNVIRWSSYASLILLGLQALELSIRTLAHNPTGSSASLTGDITNRGLGAKHWLLASWWNVLDAVVVGGAIIGNVALLAGAHQSLPLDVSDIFEVAARALPWLRLISALPTVRGVVEIVASIAGLLLHFVMVYAGISYGFVIVGMAIFGGYDQSDANAFCQACQLWSYSTFPRAWLNTLQQTVGNNWNSIMMPNLDAAGTCVALQLNCAACRALCCLRYLFSLQWLTLLPSPALRCPNLRPASPCSRWGAFYFMAYRFFLTDLLMTLIEGAMLDLSARAEEDREKLREAEAAAAEMERRAAEAAALGEHDDEANDDPDHGDHGGDGGHDGNGGGGAAGATGLASASRSRGPTGGSNRSLMHMPSRGSSSIGIGLTNLSSLSGRTTGAASSGDGGSGGGGAGGLASTSFSSATPSAAAASSAAPNAAARIAGAPAGMLTPEQARARALRMTLTMRLRREMFDEISAESSDVGAVITPHAAAMFHPFLAAAAATSAVPAYQAPTAATDQAHGGYHSLASGHEHVAVAGGGSAPPSALGLARDLSRAAGASASVMTPPGSLAHVPMLVTGNSTGGFGGPTTSSNSSSMRGPRGSGGSSASLAAMPGGGSTAAAAAGAAAAAAVTGIAHDSALGLTINSVAAPSTSAPASGASGDRFTTVALRGPPSMASGAAAAAPSGLAAALAGQAGKSGQSAAGTGPGHARPAVSVAVAGAAAAGVASSSAAPLQAGNRSASVSFAAAAASAMAAAMGSATSGPRTSISAAGSGGSGSGGGTARGPRSSMSGGGGAGIPSGMSSTALGSRRPSGFMLSTGGNPASRSPTLMPMPMGFGPLGLGAVGGSAMGSINGGLSPATGRIPGVGDDELAMLETALREQERDIASLIGLRAQSSSEDVAAAAATAAVGAGSPAAGGSPQRPPPRSGSGLASASRSASFRRSAAPIVAVADATSPPPAPAAAPGLPHASGSRSSP